MNINLHKIDDTFEKLCCVLSMSSIDCSSIKVEERERERGLGGPGHGPVFGTPFGPSLGLGPISVHLGHGLVRS